MKFSSPLIFQSKLLCFSLLYLFCALFLAVYFTFSAARCIFRSSPFDPLQGPLFSYPLSYGQHKIALPTTRSSCTSPVFFSDYWDVLEEFQNLFANSTAGKYMQGNAESFGGNFDFQKRISYFDHYDNGIEIPCGFFTRFPITPSDRSSMEKCGGLVVASAIFNDHDKIRQPRGLGSKTLDHACFFMFVDEATVRILQFHNLVSRRSKEFKIGAWRIIRVWSDQLYENPAMNGVIPKYLIHRLFPNSKYSIWVDAKLQLMVDPFLLIHSLVVVKNVDMAISKHPFFEHTMEEVMATARWKKWWDVNTLKIQMETYCENGLQPWNSDKPYPTDHILVLHLMLRTMIDQNGLNLFTLLRKHSEASNLYSCLLFNELEGFNPRDQLPFAFVRDKMKPKLEVNMFEVEVFEQVALEYRHNLKQGGGANVGPKTKIASSDLFDNGNGTCGKCERYLLKMWGESHD